MDKILNCKSATELKNLGIKFELLKQTLRLNGFKNIKAKGWNDLFDKLQEYKKQNEAKARWNVEEELRRNAERFKQEQPKFESELDKIIFNLVKLDGLKRVIALNITPEYFRKKDLAKSWYRKMSKLVHPDTNKNPLSQQAFYNVTDIYKQMLRTAV